VGPVPDLLLFFFRVVEVNIYYHKDQLVSLF
jgi:hypothetical protein